MDKIYIKGMEFFGYHGVMEEEKRLGQKFIIDLEVSCNLRSAGESDDLTNTISYAELYECTKEIVENKKYNLIEALAEDIASMVRKHPLCCGVKVKINKPGAPVKGVFDSIGIEIER